MNKATKAIIFSKGKYLLQLRDKNLKISYPNTWGFFGGMMEDYETPEECINRELMEELNVRSKIIKEDKVSIHKISNCKHFFFQMKILDKIYLKNLNEGQAFGWFTKEEIKKLSRSWELDEYFNSKLN